MIKLDLFEGKEIDEEEISRLIKEKEFSEAREKTIINKIFTEEKVVETDIERALKLAKKRLKTLINIKDKEKVKRRLYNFLLRRGFSYETIKTVMDKLQGFYS